MAYLLVALTFMASILFYSLYPRTDTAPLLDMPAAESAVYELLTQHAAAVESATVPMGTTSRYENTRWARFMPSETGGRPAELSPSKDANLYYDYLPIGYTENPIHKEGFALTPRSFLLCVNNATGKATTTCGHAANGADFPWGTSDYLITVLSLEDIVKDFPHQMRYMERALGEKAQQTSYDARMTRTLCKNAEGQYGACGSSYPITQPKVQQSTNCGLIVSRDGFDPYQVTDYDPYNADFVLSNTKIKTVSIPRTFTNQYKFPKRRPLEGDTQDEKITYSGTHLACITSLKVTYAGCCNGIEQSLCPASASDTENVERRYGCYWNTNKKACVSVCETYISESTCTAAEKYGCIWRATEQKCTSACGVKMIYPHKATGTTTGPASL